ncbi:Transposon protein [Phytophthora palmivora]|uniref:Transposon protein n=1 Tax=Phytophthora palmivora TaxID=4796 RepID=A0A2P4YRW9_9STRA|nr:Transposon protein [Phytophthora palmivora]
MDGVPVHTLAHASAQGSSLDVLSLDWEDDDDELIAQQLLFSASPSCFRDTIMQRGGSRPGKSKNKERDFEARYKRFMKQYFDENPVYNDDEFRERNRMSKPMFMRVLEGVLDVDSEYFEQRRDATGRIGIHPIMKISAALRVLAYGIPAACVDENLEISSTVVYNSIMHFVTAVDKRFGAEYLRSPTEEDTLRLLEMNASRGFVGMWCSIDCMHWEWKNCPYGWAGQFKGAAERLKKHALGSECKMNGRKAGEAWLDATTNSVDNYTAVVDGGVADRVQVASKALGGCNE